MIVLSLGSNIAPRKEYLASARKRIAEMPDTRILKESTIIETEPVGAPEEFADRRYLNQVIAVESGLGAYEFSKRIHAIEDALGRVRTDIRNTPRTVDIDIITFNDLVLNDPDLTVPHPRARERAFVLEPLREILPGFEFPVV